MTKPGLCETTPGVKSYAGYVHLPPNFLDDMSEVDAQNYPINTYVALLQNVSCHQNKAHFPNRFFWFFEARTEPHNAPLAIWLNGGPGGSSLMGLLEENGPCFVSEDSKSTYLNEWSWNNNVNSKSAISPVMRSLWIVETAFPDDQCHPILPL